MIDIFVTRSVKYNFKSHTDFALSSANLGHFGINSLKFMATWFPII